MGTAIQKHNWTNTADFDALYRSRRILLANSNDSARRLTAMILRSEGYTVIEAATGFAALEQIAIPLIRNEPIEGPAVLIMDTFLAGVSTLSILAGLREAKWGTPIVLTGVAYGSRTYEDATRLGADAIFDKPLDLDILCAVVKSLVTDVQPQRKFRDTVADDGPPTIRSRLQSIREEAVACSRDTLPSFEF